MRHKFLGLLAFSLVIPGFVMSPQTPAHADGLKANAIIVQGETNRSKLFSDGSVRSNLHNPSSFVQLNPQPEPPGHSQIESFVQLNPQPLPPGKTRPGSSVQLNPQPLPPRIMNSLNLK